MKVKFTCDSGANIHSARTEILTLDQIGITEYEWRELSEEEKYKCVEDWANDKIEMFYEELE